MVIFGGKSSRILGDTWEWDGIGSSWIQQSLSTNPQPQASPMVYDAKRRAILMFGDRTWFYGSQVAASHAAIGTSCPGTNGPPILSGGVPFLGNSGMVLDTISARASAPCAFGLAAASQNLSLGGGCSLYLSGAIVLLPATSNASGFASISFGIPDDPALQGGLVYAQGVVADPLGAFGGAAFTGGLRLTLGR